MRIRIWCDGWACWCLHAFVLIQIQLKVRIASVEQIGIGSAFSACVCAWTTALIAGGITNSAFWRINTIVVHTLLLPPERQDATVREQAQRLLGKAWVPVESAIEGREYLIGDFSAADTMLGHACIMSKRLGTVNEGNYPNLSAYAERLQARPACAKAFSAWFLWFIKIFDFE